MKTGSKQADPSGLAVRKMVARWISKGNSGKTAEQVLAELDESDDELQPVCMHCDDVRSDRNMCMAVHSNIHFARLPKMPCFFRASTAAVKIAWSRI